MLKAMLLLLLLFGISPYVYGDFNCATFPKDQQPWCVQVLGMAKMADKMCNLSRNHLHDLQRLQIPNFAVEPCQCEDLKCLEAFLRTAGKLSPNETLHKSVRKEIRIMSDEERARYQNAVQKLKADGVFDMYARFHNYHMNPGAHDGPAFLPWHREYLKRFECKLRQVDPNSYLPYFDSTLDENCIKTESILWTAIFMGNDNGPVVTGPFANWTTTTNTTLFRKVNPSGVYIKEQDISNWMNSSKLERNFIPDSGCSEVANMSTVWSGIESIHGLVHVSIGGQMRHITLASNDPVFYNHHSFVDLIWEQWRVAKETVEQREKSYPLDNDACSSCFHRRGDPMMPFEKLTNIDGMRNFYTDNLYEYAPRPTCETNCGNSKFLFCDKSKSNPSHCATKLRVNGTCAGYINGEEPCYNGVCKEGICVENPKKQKDTISKALREEIQSANFTHIEDCYNYHSCCQYFAENGLCMIGFTRIYCPAACKMCTPLKYALRDECVDRNLMCTEWAKNGECRKNAHFMDENCRKTCNKCGKVRSESCTKEMLSTTLGDIPNGATLDCYNRFVCCQDYALDRQCTHNREWMIDNCPVSCGYCMPNDYDYGTCTDYHLECREKASNGECTDSWMKENCRYSCGTCFSEKKLREMCRGDFNRRFRLAKKVDDYP